MDMDRLKGAAQEVGGRVQQGLGKLTGDHATEAEGVAREMGGKAQGLFGEAKDKIRHTVEDASDYARDVVGQGGDYARQSARAVESSVKDYPVVYLLAAAAVGFIASKLLNDRDDRRTYRR